MTQPELLKNMQEAYFDIYGEKPTYETLNQFFIALEHMAHQEIEMGNAVLVPNIALILPSTRQTSNKASQPYKKHILKIRPRGTMVQKLKALTAEEQAVFD